VLLERTPETGPAPRRSPPRPISAAEADRASLGCRGGAGLGRGGGLGLARAHGGRGEVGGLAGFQWVPFLSDGGTKYLGWDGSLRFGCGAVSGGVGWAEVGPLGR